MERHAIHSFIHSFIQKFI